MTRYAISSALLVALVASCTFGGDDEAPSAAQDGGVEASLDALPDTPPEASQPEVSAPETSVPESSPPDAPSAPELTGTWAQLWVTSSFDTLPAIGQVVGTTTSLNLVTLQQQGTDVSMHVEVCTVEVDSGTPLVKEIVPEAFAKALGPLDRVAHVQADPQGWLFVQPQHVELHSVTLADPMDPLPTEASDVRVLDGDADGKPGLTLQINGMIDGAIYVVVRDIHEVSARLTSETQVDGLITWTKDQNVLGSDNAILASNPTKSVPNTDASKSYVKMIKLQAESNCPWLVSNRQSVFGP